MDFPDDPGTISNSRQNFSRAMNSSPWFEIRLFYVRFSPCSAPDAPDRLLLRHLPRPMGVLLEINGSRILPAEFVTLTLRRDRFDKNSGEITYISTDNVRVAGDALEFEVLDGEDLVLCGSLERIEANWMGKKDNLVVEKDQRTGWSMDCYSAVSSPNSSSFLRGKNGFVGLNGVSPAIEVYVAGCCSGFPLILTKTIPLSSKKKTLRQGMLDVIPEDEEAIVVAKTNGVLVPHNLAVNGSLDDSDSEDKIARAFYPDVYSEEDGQLSWFNAGVRVGVGIGLGMCLGIGIGVGLMMRSYQATTRVFKRRFI